MGRAEGGGGEAVSGGHCHNPDEMQVAWDTVLARGWRGTGGSWGHLGSRICKRQRGEREDLIKHGPLLGPSFLGFPWLVG